jgi:hypothetical protein
MTLIGLSIIMVFVMRNAVIGSGPSKASESLAAYQWDDRAWVASPQTFNRSMDRMHSAGVTDLYIDITRAVTYLRQDPAAVAPYLRSLGRLLVNATKRDIRIHALFGDPNWSTTDRQAPDDALAIVKRFERQEGKPLAGVQFDVEPWGLSTWPTNKADYLASYLSFVGEVSSSFRSSALPGSLGFAVPYWFDGTTEALPDGSVPLVSILKSLDSVAQPYIVVMAYRNHATGTNGSIELMAPSLALAEHSNVAVIAGQELGDVQPPSTTYHARSAADLNQALAQLREALQRSDAFSGIAVDDAAGLLAFS